MAGTFRGWHNGARRRTVGRRAGTDSRCLFQRLRQLIASKQECFLLSGKIEADESYVGGVRKGRRGRGTAGKVPAAEILLRPRQQRHWPTLALNRHMTS